MEGKSLLPVFEGKQRDGHATLCWEHEGNSAVRQGKWKLVSAYPDWWELYDMEADRTEMHNLADQTSGQGEGNGSPLQGVGKASWCEQNWPLPGMSVIPMAAPATRKRDW